MTRGVPPLAEINRTDTVTPSSNILEADFTCIFSDDRTRMRIPGRQDIARAYFTVFPGNQGRAVWQSMTLTLAAILVSNNNISSVPRRWLHR